jgi:hypothetical protein
VKNGQRRVRCPHRNERAGTRPGEDSIGLHHRRRLTSLPQIGSLNRNSTNNQHRIILRFLVEGGWYDRPATEQAHSAVAVFIYNNAPISKSGKENNDGAILSSSGGANSGCIVITVVPNNTLQCSKQFHFSGLWRGPYPAIPACLSCAGRT